VIDALSELLAKYRAAKNRDPRVGHAIVVGADGASLLLQELFARVNPRGVTITPDMDELFRYEGVPVRLRIQCVEGHAFVVPNEGVAAPSCCDQTCVQTLMLALKRGDA
jgi:hypothetical protein